MQKATREKELYRSEFRYGAVSKSLPLPAGVDENAIEATYKAGILEIDVPVDQAKASATRIPVQPA